MYLTHYLMSAQEERKIRRVEARCPLVGPNTTILNTHVLQSINIAPRATVDLRVERDDLHLVLVLAVGTICPKIQHVRIVIEKKKEKEENMSLMKERLDSSHDVLTQSIC
jgi:hypothetical protein